MSEFVIQIVFNEPYLDENNKTKINRRVLLLSSVESNNVSSSNTITEHPIVSGDMISDHSYKNPTTLQFSGYAALKGNKGLLVDSQEISLVDVEDLLFKLKNEAYLCSIVKLSTENVEDIRFKTYENMVLQNFSYSENINTLSYNLSFRQVLVANIQELDVDVDDRFLPDVTEPVTTSFTDTLIDWEQVTTLLTKILYDADLITVEFLNYMSSLSEAAVITLVGATVGTIVAVSIAKSVVLSAAIPGLGAIVGGAIAVVAIIYGIVNLINDIKQKSMYKVDQFKAYDDDMKTKKEVERFIDFQSEIAKQLLELNNSILVYKVSSDNPQECMLSIDNNYYIFTFTRNNVNDCFDCSISDINERQLKYIKNIFSLPTNYNDCRVNNALFRSAEIGSYVHMLNINSENEKKLSNFCIVVSSINPEDYTKLMKDIIINAITY